MRTNDESTVECQRNLESSSEKPFLLGSSVSFYRSLSPVCLPPCDDFDCGHDFDDDFELGYVSGVARLLANADQYPTQPVAQNCLASLSNKLLLWTLKKIHQ